MDPNMDVNDVWAYDQSQVLDDKAAIARGHVQLNGMAALHGSWTRMRLFRIHQARDHSLMIVDDDGRIARFAVVSGTNPPSWTATSDAKWFSTAEDLAKPPFKPVEITAKPIGTFKITPSLVLASYGTDDDVPSGCAAGDVYVTESDDPELVQAQRLALSTDGKRLTWSVHERAHLTWPLLRVPAQQGPPKGASFSDTFAGASEWGQTAFPYYGFHPLNMLIYSESGAYALPGTPAQSVAYTDRPGQTFIAPLIFEFPAADSTDYVRSPDLEKQPNLPIGRRWVPIETSSETRHTQVISSVADRIDSWSTTFGMSAGVEGMLSVGGSFKYHGKIETQQSKESRYVISRAVTTQGVNIIHVPSLRLHPEFLSWLRELSDVVIAGGTPDWKPFVRHFGSHYLHAMTYGSLKYGETRMSLEGELHAETKGFDIKATAEATVKDVNLKSEADYAHEWSDKLQTRVEVEDVACYEIGGKGAKAVGILYDLRPISELLSPLLVRYNPADTRGGGALAPWVWTHVRASLEAHLDTLGLNRPIPDKLLADYKLRRIRVSVGRPKFTVTSGSPPAWRDMTLAGWIRLTTNDTTDVQKTLEPATPWQIMGLNADSIATLPEELTYCIVAMRAGARPKVTVETHLGLVARTWVMQYLQGDERLANYRFNGTSTVDAAVPEGRKADGSAAPIAGVNNARIKDSTLEATIPLRYTEVG